MKLTNVLIWVTADFDDFACEFIRKFGKFNMSNCSLFKKHPIECGPAHGHTETVLLFDCCDDVSYHLNTCHLSRCKLKEYELILQRAGLDQISPEGMTKFRVCPRHRYDLGRCWRPPTTCQYPMHSGSSKSLKGREVISVEMAKAIVQLMGASVPIGSRK